MAGSQFGKIFHISTFGESHGKALGVVVDGCPAGLSLSEEDIQEMLERRRPGKNLKMTQRREGDKVEILSGIFEGKTTGTSIAMVVWNEDQRSKDYGEIAHAFRPGHADYGFFAKYGFRDYRGGGRSSGRETIARVAAGAIGTGGFRPGQGHRACRHFPDRRSAEGGAFGGTEDSLLKGAGGFCRRSGGMSGGRTSCRHRGTGF